MLIDVHAHYLPRQWPDAPFWPAIRADEGGYTYLVPGGQAVPIPKGLFDLVQRGANLAEKGVGQALSIPPFAYTYELAAAPAAQICRFLNDSLARAVQDNPRFLGLATLPLPDVEASIAEVKRCREAGFKGITLGTSVGRKNLDEPAFYPLWETLRELDLPVLLNAHGGLGKARLTRYGLANLLGNGFELATAGASLIFGGILERFKGLKFCLTLGGGGLPYAMGRLTKGMSVKLSEGARIAADPLEYFQDLYFDTLTHSAQALEFLVSLAGVKRVVWGSDDPFAMGEGGLALGEAAAAGVGEETLRDNAARLLGITV